MYGVYIYIWNYLVGWSLFFELSEQFNFPSNEMVVKYDKERSCVKFFHSREKENRKGNNSTMWI